MKVSAIIVSRMDRPIGDVTDFVIRHVDELIVVRGHGGVWERWEAVSRAKCDVIYTQDDDAIVDVPAVLAAYDPDFVACNMPKEHRRDYPDGIALVGWGCVFHRSLGEDRIDSAWRQYDVQFPRDGVFTREADRVLTGLSKLKLVDMPIAHLPCAHGRDRMSLSPNHGESLQEIRRRIYAVRSAKGSSRD
jgi:hypothetical protein